MGENKDLNERREPINAYHLLVPLSSSFMGSVVCHTLPLFGKLPLSIISFDFLYDSFTHALFSGLVCIYTDPLHIQPSLESAMPRVPVLTTIRGCSTNFTVLLCKVWWKCWPNHVLAVTRPWSNFREDLYTNNLCPSSPSSVTTSVRLRLSIVVSRITKWR